MIWDVSALSKWHVTGPDALAAMDRLTTRPTAPDRPGQVRYVMLLNDDGLLVEEATRYVLGPHEVWLVGNEDRPAMAAHIEDSIADLDVRVDNRTDEVVSIAVQGPRSCDVLAPLVDARSPLARLLPSDRAHDGRRRRGDGVAHRVLWRTGL